MSKKQVSYSYCSEYDFELIKGEMEKILSSFPDLNAVLSKKEGLNVLIKPNLLAPRSPDKAVTTHPTVIRALIHYLKRFNCNITIADSPAGIYNEKILDKLYKTCELDKLAEETGVRLNFDTSDRMVELKGARVLKKSPIITPGAEADFIFNFAKLKTHTLTRLTCASKNLFGLMPGILKYRQHIAMPDLDIFSDMLLDIQNHFEGRVFHLVDGILGMEGEGPGSGGIPRFAGALFGGWDSKAVDVLACHIMGMPVDSVPTLKGFRGIEDIELVKFSEIRAHEFILPPKRNSSMPDRIPKWIQAVITDIVVAKPIINPDCKGCNICVEACPAEIIRLKGKKAVISGYKNCIRCYCCQEACPHGAITLSTPLAERIYKIFRKK